MVTQEQSFRSPYKIIINKDDSYCKLYLQDCLTGIKENIPKDCIDVVVTFPPYNIGINYNKYNDNLPRKKYLEWLKEIGLQIKRVLKDDGSFFLNIGNKPSDQWIAWDVSFALRDDFVLQNTIHWIKSIAIGKQDVGKHPNIIDDVSVGHFKPISSNRFINDCHEYISHFTKEGNTSLDKLAVGVPYQDKSNIGRWKYAKKQDKRDRGNIWIIPYETIQKKNERPHPATFPMKLPEMCIKIHGIKEKMIVMDPFLGIGSTAITCSRLGVSFVRFEIDKEYLDEAINRLNTI